MQRARLDEWLREADRHISVGRYSAADELLQRVYSVDPDNERADAAHDRIHSLIKQFDGRVGLSPTVQLEVRKYRESHDRRKTNLLQAQLVTAKRSLEEGNIPKAASSVARALRLDPLNTYATFLAGKIEELKTQREQLRVMSDAEQKFSSLLRESWVQGVPNAQQADVLTSMQKQLAISANRRFEMEHQLKRVLYKDALTKIWQAGGLAAFSVETIEALRSRFEVSVIDHSAIEAEFLREARENRLKGLVLLVDGNEKSLMTSVHEIRSRSFAVLAAVSVQEALVILATTEPDAIVTTVDVVEKMDGFELFNLVRSDPEKAAVAFMIAAPEFDRTTLLVGKRLGVDEFLTQPIDFDMLAATIEGKMLQRMIPGRP